MAALPTTGPSHTEAGNLEFVAEECTIARFLQKATLSQISTAEFLGGDCFQAISQLLRDAWTLAREAMKSPE
jgi:hypothetical protein